ncbi:C-GCAxxG-C-C family protein [Dielma fastidiosa]|uniref:C-GCAxxG-C-C family protein n=1 Tax=Dielma fastidiosa TaxID=1034346 RepID=UPI000EC6F8F5|nr:C-GCAxxG-C-C family protein [Dielma fastidiosa]HAH95161.1 hypothetical protein [Dielma fastidiosa]
MVGEFLVNDYVEKALANQRNGYNCAQAVVCAYADAANISEADAYRMAEGFGSGLAGCQLTCGALLGMAMVISLLNSSGKLGDKQTRGQTYKLIQQGLKMFETMNQSTQCAQLKGMGSQPMLRSCPGCVEDSVRIIEELKNSCVCSGNMR